MIDISLNQTCKTMKTMQLTWVSFWGELKRSKIAVSPSKLERFQISWTAVSSLRVNFSRAFGWKCRVTQSRERVALDSSCSSSPEGAFWTLWTPMGVSTRWAGPSGNCTWTEPGKHMTTRERVCSVNAPSSGHSSGPASLRKEQNLPNWADPPNTECCYLF